MYTYREIYVYVCIYIYNVMQTIATNNIRKDSWSSPLRQVSVFRRKMYYIRRYYVIRCMMSYVFIDVLYIRCMLSICVCIIYIYIDVIVYIYIYICIYIRAYPTPGARRCARCSRPASGRRRPPPAHPAPIAIYMYICMYIYIYI